MKHICYENIYLNNLGRNYYNIGKKIMKNSNICVLILAGGQGTRLGIQYPKGCYYIENTCTSLYGIHCKNLIKIGKLFNTHITLILMVSRYTDNQTREHFRENNYFGFDENDVFFIRQGESVCYDLEGNILMENERDVCKSPNGNGDVFKALNCIMDVLEIRGIKFVNVVSIDNVLSRICDPVAIGCFFYNEYDILSKGVKRLENEKAGVFVYEDKLRIIEYTEIEDQKMNNEQSANICNHIFSIKFIQEMAYKELPVHDALKKIPYYKDGEIIHPKEPNGIKKEHFIFDSFEFTNKNGFIEVPRSLEFSSLKNSNEIGIDCPKSCLLDIKKRNKILENMDKSTEYDRLFILKDIFD